MRAIVMTDMHREAFERFLRDEMCDANPQKTKRGEYMEPATILCFKGWQAAIRYRDEQDASGTLACAGCGEPADDPHTFDCPMVDRDEQEKQA